MRAVWGLSTRRRLVAAAVLLLGLLPAASSASVPGRSRGAAAHAALHALRADGHRGAELVLGLTAPLPAGTVISLGGPARPSVSGRITRSPERVVVVLNAPAWFFYQDLAPFQQYTHPGRVALVDVRTGSVKVTGKLSWPPFVNGALPAFLASETAYSNGRYRVLYRPYAASGSTSQAAAGRAAARAAARDVSRALDPGLGGTVADLLAAEHACTVRFSDTVPGGYYAFAQVAQSRAALAYRFAQLSRFAPGFRSGIYSPSSGLSPVQFVSRLISRVGCRDVLLYLAGGGYAGQSAVNIGMGAGAGQVLHQDVTLGQLHSLVRSHRGVRFELILDAPHAGAFHSLTQLGNVLLVATPVAPAGGSFTYLSGVSQNGTMVANDTNPLHLLQLTDRLAFGIDQVIDNPLEVAQMQSLAQEGKLPSPLAYLLARAFGLGAPVDFVANSGAGSPPDVQTQGFPAPPSGPPLSPVIPTVTADPDAYAATASTVLNVTAANGVLANDSDSAQNPLTVDQLNGAGGTPPLHGTSAQGAAVTMNADGSFSYDPTASATLRSLPNGQSTTDTFTYRADDGRGGTETATVTITVAGTAHRAPTLSGIESSTVQYDAGTIGAPVTLSLAISAPDDTDLTGATAKISSGLVSGEDALSFNAGNGITGSYDPSTGVLNLAGTSSVANYQAALRSVTYGDSNGTNPSTGPRTISFQVNDGHSSNNLSNTVSRDVQVNPNPPPIAGDDSASTDKNTAIDIPVLANDSDTDGDTLHVASVDTTGTKGSVSINGNGTIHYDPNGQFAGLQQGQTATDTFTYQASDGFHNSGSATVTVTITGLNDPPVLSNIESSTLQYDAGTPPVPITSTLTISNPHGTTLAGATMTISSGLVSSEDALIFVNQNGITGSYDSATGVLTLTGPASVADYQAALRSVTYSDPNGTNPTTGPRTLSFQVNDGAASNNLSNTASRTVQVNPNPPPAAGNVSASTDKHTAIDINVLSSDSDPDGDTLTVTSVNTTGTLGSVSINPGQTIHYDPNGQFNGLTAGQTATDTFGYTVSDGFHTASATVTVTITGVNDAPVVSNIETTPLSYRAQDPAIQVTNTLTISDDDDATLGGATASITSGLSSGNDVLSFTNQNGITGSYNASTGALTLSGNASVPDYQTALRSIEFFSSDNSASPAARTVSFTVTDSVGATSTGTAQRAVDVSEANQPPVAVNQSYTAVGNTPLGVGTTPTGPAATVSGSLLTGDSDPDSGSAISVTGNTTPAHGTVTVNPDGTFTYTPNAGFSGTDTFQYTITDSDDPANPKSATATATITVGPVVWYVDDSKTSAGTGQSTAPFNTLAAANSAAGANSIIFLYQGSATYTSGVSMKSGEDLFGQPHGLTVDGYSLVAAGGSNPTITNTLIGGDGVDLAEGSDVEAVNIASPNGNGVTASNVNSATVGGNNSVAISGAGGIGIRVSGGNGNFDFANTSVTGSTANSISIAGHTGGTVSLGGNITDHGTGIVLSANTGATINFTGTLSISTGVQTGFSATGGGTVSATGTGSTITTTTGTALDVSSTTIGSGGLTFQSISSNGANPGVNLLGTGTSGGLTVTGSGTTAGSGGTIQGSAGEGINLSSTSSPSFTDMVIENNGADGINGSQVNGLTLAGSTVSGNGTQANVSGENDDGLDFSPNGTGSPNGLTGTVSITNSTIIGSADNNAIISDTSGTLNLTVTGSTFSSNNTTTGEDGLHVDANGTTNATVSVTGSSVFTNNSGDQFQFAAGATSTGTNNVTFSGNTTTEAAGINAVGGGVLIGPTGNSNTTLTVDNNNIQDLVSSNGIGIDNESGAGTISGTVNGNTIGNPSVANSGSGNGIGIFAEGSETETLAITNNNISQYQNLSGINFLDREGNPTMNLTITGNTISHPGSFGSWGILGEAGATSGPPIDSGTVCVAFGANSITGSAAAGQGGADVELDQGFDANFRLPGYTAGVTDTNAVQTYLQGKISGSPSAIATLNQQGSGDGFQGTTSCPTPS